MKSGDHTPEGLDGPATSTAPGRLSRVIEQPTAENAAAEVVAAEPTVGDDADTPPAARVAFLVFVLLLVVIAVVGVDAASAGGCGGG